MRSLLITGATGFVGGKLIKLMETTDFNICVLSRQQHPYYKTIVCDLGQKQIPASEYNPIECIKTNVYSAESRFDISAVP